MIKGEYQRFKRDDWRNNHTTLWCRKKKTDREREKERKREREKKTSNSREQSENKNTKYWLIKRLYN